jgi:predicted nucleotidyltransferase
MINADKILPEITTRIVNEFNPLKVYLFGSYAWGSPNDNSDLDILILLDKSDESRTRHSTRAYRAIRDYSFVPVDFLVRTTQEFNNYSSVNATLQNKILKNGKLLYERKRETGQRTSEEL